MTLLPHACPALCLILTLSLQGHENKEISPPPNPAGSLFSVDLTLQDALQRALEHHPQFAPIQAILSEAQAQKAYARSILPTPIAFSMRTQNDALGSGRGEREWEAAVEMPIWLPGQRAARHAIAQAAASGSAASRDALRLQIAGLVRESLWDIHAETANLDLAQLRHKTAQALQNDVERRFKAGELAKTDVMLAQNEALQAQAQLVRAETTLRQAQTRFTILTGLNQAPAHGEEQPAELTRLDTQHPLLREADSRVARAEHARDLALVERRENPQIQLSARTQRGGFDMYFNKSVGLSLRIPFAAPGRSSMVKATAELELAKLKSERDLLKNTMVTAFEEARLNLETTRQELAIAEVQCELARENQRLAQKAFDLGEADLVQLMRVQALGYEATRARSLKKIQLQRDIARFNQSAGVMP